MPTPIRDNPLPLTAAISKATDFCADNSFLIVEVLQRIFTHKISVSQLAGPVGIARMAGDAAEMNGLAVPSSGWPATSASTSASSTCCPSPFSTAA